ncbi:MAG TPA: PHP domain-containing protein [Lachnospiraceae bacterium]|nr:PHP domain-containing protein [Lachnospiraceae bacterium]
MPDTTKMDLHLHTKEGSLDGRADVISCALELNNHGFTGMMVSDHNSYKGYIAYQQQKDKYPELKDFTVLKGLEYDTRDGGHVLIILPDAVETAIFTVRGMTIRRLQLLVHSMGGICGMSHPYGNGYFAAMHTNHVKKNSRLQKGFDFIEVFNNHISDEANKMAVELAERLKKPGTAGSDSHSMRFVGTAETTFDVPVRSRDELIAAIMGGHITGAHKVEGTNIYPLSKGIIKWSGIFGYWVWNKGASVRNIRRRKKVFRNWKDEKK